MIYAMSDLHGCYDKYVKMLDMINFSNNDTLYILGDVVDRGKDGVRILFDMMKKDNIIPLMGNHDYTAYYLLKTLSQNAKRYNADKINTVFGLWLADGGNATYAEFKTLSQNKRKKIISYLGSFWIYDETEAGGRKYFLSHTVPEKKRMIEFDKLLWQEFIAGEPEYEKTYYKNKIIVTGHTPTDLIDEKSAGSIYSANNHLAIDCGAVFGGPLACICLDTLEEYYAE